MGRLAGLVLAFVAAVMLAVQPAAAMTFTVATLKTGLHVIAGSGEIVRGDARRLAKVLGRADRDMHGSIELYLDSIGGRVDEALALADLMDQAGVATIVQKGALCASACASVLFVSGTSRTVQKGGVLLIHSCYDRSNGAAMSDCNAIISAHAEAEGVSGLTMMALQEVAGSDNGFVFDRESAACFGLTLAPGSRQAKNPKLPPCLAKAMKKSGRK